MRGGLGLVLAVALAACEPAEAPAPVVPTRAVTVRVVDARGAALENAELSVDDAPFLRAVDGGFRLEGLSEGTPHRLRARSEGHLEKALPLPFGKTVTLVLEDVVQLSGRVFASDGGAVSPVTVRLGGQELVSRDGGFSFAVKPGAWTVEVEATGFATTRVETTAPAQLLVGLEPEAAFSGRVLDLDGAPVKNAKVSVTRERSAAVDDEGRFLLGGLSAGTYQLHLEGPWRADLERSVRAGERVELELREPEGARLSGTVVNTRGQSIPNARVSVGSRQGLSDAKGRFVLRSLPEGPVVVRVEAPWADPITLRVTAPDAKVVATIEEPNLITGRVVDEHGRPMKSFRVDVHDFTAEDGRFSWPVLEHQPGGFFFDAPGYARKVVAVDTKAGRTELGDVRLSRGRQVSGVVTDRRTGRPLEGALVDVSSVRPPGKLVLSESYGAARTDAAGRYRLLVDPTSTRLMATCDGYAPYEARLAPGATSASIALDPGGTVTVRVLDLAGQPLRAAQVTLSARDDSVSADPEGDDFVAKGLARGAWTVAASAPGRSFPVKTLEVRGGPQTVRLMEADPNRTLTVRVPGATELFIASGPNAKAGTRVQGDVAERLLPGKWTLVATRALGERLEVSTHVVVVLDQPGQKDVVVTPRWTPVR